MPTKLPSSKNPGYWRARAKATRDLAGDMIRPETKSRMLKLAEAYEARAVKAEKQLAETSTKPEEPT